MKKSLLLLLTSAGMALHALSQVVVSDCQLNGWQIYLEPTGSVSFVEGPGAPPLPVGSVEFALGANGNGKAALINFQYGGVPLSSLTELKYSTYVQFFTGGQAAALELLVDNTGDGYADDRLVFEPLYQTGAYITKYEGVVVPQQNGGVGVLLDTWQEWNALIGGWWPRSGGEPGPPNLLTLDYYLSLHPTSTIANNVKFGEVVVPVGGVWLTTGGANTWNDFIGNADELMIGVNGSTTTYNFEPCDDGNGKITVCHKGKTKSVPPSALKAHLKHGDQLGPCADATKTKTGITARSEEALTVIPATYQLRNYPNPFTNETRILYNLPQSSNISITVYDLMGRKVATLFQGEREAGQYSLPFNASGLGKGVYYSVLQATTDKGTLIRTQAMLVK